MLHTLPFRDLCHLGIIQPCISFDSGIRKISVHSLDLCQIGASAHRTHIHIQFLMPAVVTVRQGEVYSFIISFCHGASYQRFNRFYIVTDRIFDILDLSSVAQIPEPAFQILFLDRRNILRHMAVKTVAYIFSV